MRVVCAPDSFKESMTAAEAASAMARGIRRVVPDADIVELPLSDGGEGFLDALTASLGARRIAVDVHGPLGEPRQAEFALAPDGLAVIEMARAAGLELNDPSARDVWRSSTLGVGELIEAALDSGAARLVLGIGGSATNDGGAGMLAALGVRFLDAEGVDLAPTPDAQRHLARVDASALDGRLAGVRVDVACDVDNPLLGTRGASAIFGPQKGATAADVTQLDAALARLVELDGGEAIASVPGAGAAGGLGYALLRHLGATLRPGIDLVAEAVGLADAVRNADLVLTGEGSVDAQTASGKTPMGVASAARSAGADCVILAGRVAPDADLLLDLGVRALVPIVPEAMDLPTALATGEANLERATATVMRLIGR